MYVCEEGAVNGSDGLSAFDFPDITAAPIPPAVIRHAAPTAAAFIGNEADADEGLTAATLISPACVAYGIRIFFCLSAPWIRLNDITDMGGTAQEARVAPPYCSRYFFMD